MRWDTIFEIAFISFLIVLAIYMRFHPETLAPPHDKPGHHAAADPAEFCAQAQLAPGAAEDCRAAVAAAHSEADRARVERTFGLSAVEPKTPRPAQP